MNTSAKTVMGTAGSLLLAATAAGGLAVEAVPAVALDTVAASASEVVALPSRGASAEAVQGDFRFTQTEVTPNAVIARTVGAAPQYLCGSSLATDATGNLDAGDWAIEVGGDVSNELVITSEQLRDEVRGSAVMSCSCSGNPAGGAASVNAEVSGIDLHLLMEQAGLAEGVNTAVFASADGYEVALPVDYLADRYTFIVFSVNGEEVTDVMGGANQLWLGSTSARYFARDIVSITFEARDEAPAAPGTPEAGESYDYLPNVGVFFGGEVG